MKKNRNYSITALTKEEYDRFMIMLKTERAKEEKRENDLTEISIIFNAIRTFLNKGGQISFTNEWGDSSTMCGSRACSYNNEGEVVIDDLEFYYNGEKYSVEEIDEYIQNKEKNADD